jgi:hypothetical protein
MSTISFTFNTQALDFSPLTRGQVNIVFNDGSLNIPLIERLTTSPSTAEYFQEVAWIGGSEAAVDNQQAINFRNAFNRDYKFIGNNGDGSKNLTASVLNNQVIITATNGTFISAAYTGNILVLGTPDVNNTVQVSALAFGNGISSNGNCDTIEYNAFASGGTAPYTLKGSIGNIVTSWDGSSYSYSLPRGTVQNLRCIDSDLTESTRSVIVPRKLAEGDFSIDITGYETSSDIIVNRDIVIANTTPLQYSLDEITENTGANYQSTNSFPGVLEGQYRLFIKDVFGCEIYKTINVLGFEDELQSGVIRYFQVMEGQSIIFSEFVEFDSQTKKNYFNTGSYNEAIQGQRYNARHLFSNNETFHIGTQFKSSYPFHSITLHHKDGTMLDIPPIMISENLGVLEKMDCVRFPLSTDVTKTGVYFNGGNTYIPDTTTVLGTNAYVGTTPSWAKVGQLIYLDGVGLRITATAFDEFYGWYFIVDATTGAEVSATVQLTHNKQDYNTFEFYINPTDIQDCDVVVLEKGFSSNVFDGNQWVSERIYTLSDDDRYLLIRWNDLKNKSDIVFQSGIDFIARFEGEFIPDSDDSSETYSGDSNEYSIEQIRRLNFEVLIEGITFKQVIQLNIASALGGFSVNGLNLVCKSAPEKKRYDKSNLWSWRGKFAYGENLVSVQQDEIVLSVGTGVVGGGGTGKSDYTALKGITLIKDDNGNLIIYQNGALIRQ